MLHTFGHPFAKRVQLTVRNSVSIYRLHLAEPRVNFHFSYGQLFSMLFTSAWCIFTGTKAPFVYLQAIKVLIMKSKVLQKEIVDEGKVTALKL